MALLHSAFSCNVFHAFRITDNTTDADKIEHFIDEEAHFSLVLAFIYLLSNGSAAHVLEAQEEAANH